MAKRKFGLKKWLFVTALVMIMSILFYFWELYLYDHFLGGYDEYGIPMQASKNGIRLFFTSWPLWAFPAFIMGLLVWAKFAGTKKRVAQKVEVLESMLAALEKDIEANTETHETTARRLKSVQALYKKCKKENDALEDEFSVLMDEYQQSLDFIEKLLESQVSKRP